jgi:hypothetical protein
MPAASSSLVFIVAIVGDRGSAVIIRAAYLGRHPRE